jgi:nucleoside phosphorylase
LEGYSPKVYTGRIISGDQFINQREKADELWDTYHSLRADMEAAATANYGKIFDLVIKQLDGIL